MSYILFSSNSQLHRSLLLCCLAVVMLGCPNETPQDGPASRSSADPSETRRIVILTNGDDPFWDACEAGAFKAEEELGLADAGLSVAFERADFTDKGQVDKLKQYAVQSDIVALGISVFNPESSGVAEALKELQENGVKVMTIDGDINREKYRDRRFAYLGTDNIIGGRELGKAGKALAPNGANYAQFTGSSSAFNAIARMDGFVEGAGEKLVEVVRLEDGGDRPTARKNVQDALDRNEEIDMLVGIWAYNAPQAIAVVKDRDLRAKMKVVSFDAAKDSIREMADGNLDVMVVQNPYQMGFIGVKLLKALLEDDKSIIDEMYPEYAQTGDKDLFKTELRVVVPEGSPITPEIFEKDTVFMKHAEFEAWLKERGLTSS